MRMKAHSYLFRTCLCLAVILALIGAAFTLSVNIGARQIAPDVIWRAILSYDSRDSEQVIIRTLRLPRAITALAVGASFAVSGALMQAATRNPMASPSVLGINAGAALGLAIAMVLRPSAGFSETVLFSFGGAAFASAFIFGVGSLGSFGTSPVRLALTGTAIAALFNAFSQALAVYFKISQDLTFWNAGGISGVRPEQAALLLPWTAAGLLLAIALSRSITLLSLGDEVASGLGGRTAWIRFFACVAVLILAGSSVAVAGPIGFVGLVVPHGVRALVGVDYRRVIPISILSGGLLVLLADIVARLVNPPFETPAGAVTALIGVPFFIYLATKKQ
ncbi:MAG: iron ABC transporter permease [Eubacteriales bacterium]|nr:iron ABC transporter permease [Eubacteriales bacterium]